ncbi:hypothetical protein I79_017174 [Cricetulus griseus]|uniref:Uncharacterized protein n=1 Tax=Cricetulus griseus TaxID=10029 RepID=G3I1C1_CRIGR|nr:hypothetical protein I79_017174 [Cricetulus griseus]
MTLWMYSVTRSYCPRQSLNALYLQLHNLPSLQKNQVGAQSAGSFFSNINISTNASSNTTIQAKC